MLYVIVAGGPCTGKTTLIKVLASILISKGFKVFIIKDWARELIRLGKELGGPLPWVNRVAFEAEVARRHLGEFRRAIRTSPDIILEDSGPIATIAYCRVDGVELPRDLMDEVLSHARNVNLVFITEPGTNYFIDSERWEERSYALKIHREIVKVHNELLPGRVVKLPPTQKPEVRAHKALRYMAKYLRKDVSVLTTP